jgi:hypothetical protein
LADPEFLKGLESINQPRLTTRLPQSQSQARSASTERADGLAAGGAGQGPRAKKQLLLTSLLFMLACGNGGSTMSSMQASAWSILWSKGLPDHPVPMGAAGWYFDFPTDPTYPGCITGDSCSHVGYITQSYSGLAQHLVSMTFRIETTGSPMFQYDISSDNQMLVGAPAYVTLMLQKQDDDYGTDFSRWWTTYQYRGELKAGEYTLTVPLDPANWSSVFGHGANTSPATLQGFHDALNNLGHVGMTFGGGCCAGHGVMVTGGTARFVLEGYSIS